MLFLKIVILSPNKIAGHCAGLGNVKQGFL